MFSGPEPADNPAVAESVRKSWAEYLEGLPGLLARLACLRSLCHLKSGEYRHYGLSLFLGSGETHELLAAEHRRAFADWLALPLEEKVRDTAAYASAIGGCRAQTLHRLTQCLYRDLPPADSPDAEREIFQTDLLFAAGLLLGARQPVTLSESVQQVAT